MTKDELRSEISDLVDKVEGLENLLSDALIDKEWEESEKYSLADDVSDLEDEIQGLTALSEELQEKLDECESPTFGMSISQISCYEVFMDILERLPVGAHEIEEELIKMFLNDK